MAARYQRASVPVTSLGVDVQTAYVGPTEEQRARHRAAGGAPIVMLHSFDSSALECRRLLPLLEQQAETWALDLLGWGFNDHSVFTQRPELLLTPQLRREHLHGFWHAHVGRPMVLLGSSLGGATAIDFALHHPEAVERLVLIDSAGWSEPGSSNVPRFLAAMGVWLLRTEQLRQSAAKMAYHDKSYNSRATMLTGRLHTHMPGWADANIAFVRGGGYRIAQQISQVHQPTLVMWGRQDTIIDPADAQKFADALPNNELLWVEECGHSAHIEQAELTAQAVLRWAGVEQQSAKVAAEVVRVEANA